MTKHKPIVLSIAGFDPSGGAGILADIKTMEKIGVYGMAVTTSVTYQNDENFSGLHGLSFSKIKKQLQPLFEKYSIEWVKIGLIEDLKTLRKLIQFLLRQNQHIKIIWDPILRASAGFNFHEKIQKKELQFILDNIFMITPNWQEIKPLSKEKDVVAGAHKLSEVTHVYLKGGHNIETPGTDLIWINKRLDILHPEQITELQKHGSGCVLSSAIASYLALGNSIHQSCQLAKSYTLKFLVSNTTNLGYHQ